MTAPLATLNDLELAWRPLRDAEQPTAAYLLIQASALVRAKVPKVDQRVADGKLDPALVAGTVAAMVARVLRNPGGISSKTIGAESVTFDQSAISSSLTMTPDEMLILRGYKSQVRNPQIASVFTPACTPVSHWRPYA